MKHTIQHQLTVIFLLIAFLARSQTNHQLDSGSSILTDAGRYFSSPAKWDKKDWLVAGSLASVTAISVFYIDQPANDFFIHHHDNKILNALNLFEPAGNYYPLAAAGIFSVAGIVSKNDYTLNTALLLAESFVFTSITARAIKITAGRQRPNYKGSVSATNWKGPFFKGSSFCSGHTSVAFAAASVLAYRYNHIKWVPILSYGIATAGGIQRLYSNKHWVSDVVFSAVLGTASGLFLCKQNQKTPYQFYPIVSKNYTGLVFSYQL